VTRNVETCSIAGTNHRQGATDAHPRSPSGWRWPFIRRSFAQHLARVFLVQFIGDTFIGKAHELGERRVRPAGSARQRRNEAGQRREGVTVELPKVD